MKRLGNKLIQGAIRASGASIGTMSMSSKYEGVMAKVQNWANSNIEELGNSIYENLMNNPIETITAGLFAYGLSEVTAQAYKLSGKEKYAKKLESTSKYLPINFKKLSINERIDKLELGNLIQNIVINK